MTDEKGIEQAVNNVLDKRKHRRIVRIVFVVSAIAFIVSIVNTTLRIFDLGLGEFNSGWDALFGFLFAGSFLFGVIYFYRNEDSFKDDEGNIISIWK